MAWPPRIAHSKPHERPAGKVTQAEVDHALSGLINPLKFTRHPKAHQVIKRLWAEVQELRDGRKE